MVGPVLFQELLLGSRRNRLHILRWCYAGWLLLQLAALYLDEIFNAVISGRRISSLSLAGFAHDYIEVIVTQHFLVLLLATPTLTAGAITDEKSRGTLQYLLTAELRPGQILLGKLLARSWLVLTLTLPVLPLLGFLGVLGGLDLGGILTLLLASVFVVFGLASASLLASAVCRHTRDAVLALYTVGFLVYLAARGLHGWLADLALARQLGETSEAAAPIWGRLAAVLDCFDPLHPLGGGWTLDDPGERGRRLLAALAAWGTLGVVCLALAAWRLRPAYLRYLEGLGRKRARWWRARCAPMHGDPIRWKERHVEGIAPLALLRDFPRWLGLLLVVVASTIASGWIVFRHLPDGPGALWEAVCTFDFDKLLAVLGAVRPAGYDFHLQGFAVMLLAALVIGVRCSGAVTGERERQTWEALLLTPLETRELIRGKFWGILGAARPYLIAYAIPALALSALGGLGALFWTALWLAVTCLAVAYAGAAGLWCSVRATTSWRSLLGTLGMTYIGGCVLYAINTVVGCILAIILGILLALLGPQFLGGLGGPRGLFMMGELFQVGVCIGMTAAFILVAWRLVVSAEYRVGVLERVKHWKYEPDSYAPPYVLPAPRRRTLPHAQGRGPGGEA